MYCAAVQPWIVRVNATFPAEGDLALQSGDVASRYCLTNLLGSFENNAISILLDTGFPVFCRELRVDGICIKLQHAAIISNWLEAELSHKRVGDFCNTVFTRTCSRAQLLCSPFNLFGQEAKNCFMMGSISRSVTEFCLDLYNKLNRNAENTNIVFSPMSISVALALVHLGARNNTAAQIEEVLHVRKTTGRMSLGSDPESTETEPEGSAERQLSPSQCNKDGDLNHKEFQALLLQLQNLGERYILTLANNLFIQQGFELQQQFLTCSEELYGAMVQTVDFHGAVEAARIKINTWVESETQGKIKELFAPGVIDVHALLVLVNVIYFKASWEHKFEEQKTVQRDFKLNQNEKKRVQMMYQKRTFKLGYIEEMDAQILELPYAQKSLSMVILLPSGTADGSTTGLEQIESTMTYENLMLWASSEHMFETTVEVYLPRFKLEGTFNLNEVLQEMGMTDVFSESKADLSAMSFAKSLVLSKVVHKTYVEVNEEGTVAAAGTAAAIMGRSLPLKEVFMADHPFLFFIRHNPTDTILFFGKLCSP
uniref:Uncharacterized protein n=1 Tax=Melopsittacus undulatus TaxID=13146 RepID=A0A8C6INX8_MELUD